MMMILGLSEWFAPSIVRGSLLHDMPFEDVNEFTLGWVNEDG